ncbi:dipeptidase [Pseudalkalibacillus caeni]|uniref:Membrane dipeptidase n=1 Tax=Exobacillus caeni TaxID=2574798 RepID=A0A5R9F186_9BACL|nr:dipeptidase [Pseudalkalibacillus caeni]TLS37402.1 membrane dipeptidase [Pseudalkalibacillus caeni]
MKIFDAHCDVLNKMWSEPGLTFSDDQSLQITYEQLKKTGAKVQLFAIFVPENVPEEVKFQAALEMVDIFYQEIIDRYDDMKVILTKRDLQELKDNEIGAILTLEGADALQGNRVYWTTLYRLGVRSLGLTWNHGNAVADGILEGRGAGITDFGKKIIGDNNRRGIWTDLSHVSIKGFWDAMDIAEFPIASHSNAKKLCGHPRNLNDDQIKALIQKDGIIGVTFVPKFLRDDRKAGIRDILNHVDYLCSLGGEKNIGIGSDFDGIDRGPDGLASYAGYERLINAMLQQFPEELVKGFCFTNFADKLPEKMGLSI